MIVWLVSDLGTIGEQLDGATSDAAKAGTALADTILAFWVLGDIILGLGALLTRPRK